MRLQRRAKFLNESNAAWASCFSSARWKSREAATLLSRLFESEFGQDLGVLFLHGQQIVTSRAVVRDRLPVRACVAPIVAAEAPGEIIVAQIVGMHSPCHLHRRKNIPQINLRNAFRRLLHQRS